MTWTSGRRGGLLVAAIGGVLLAVLALTSVGLIDTAATPTASTRAQVCSEYAALIDELDSGGVFATQASIHSARKLSQLAGRYPQPASPNTDEPHVAQADADIRRVLNSVAWETPDLVTATRPIALECGWVWPVSSTPPRQQPPPQPQRPAS